MVTVSLSDITAPFLWLAAAGFAAGFLGYLLLGGGAQALPSIQAAQPAAAVETLSLAHDRPREI